MFNEALYGKRRRQDNTLIDNWIDEYLLEDSEEEDIDRSSIPITRRWINRDREAGHDHLFQDYFADDPVYNADIFRRRFRMRRHVFLRIVDALSDVYPYFQQWVDANGRRGLSALQKCTAAIRMLAYGVAADAVDDYVCIGESTTIECLEKFVEGVISVFEDEYLRKPNPNDVQRLLQMAEGRGFPGMYMSGYHGVATILLEVVASSDIWIWHAFFRVSGSNNDINVFDRSPVFKDILNDRTPEVNYTINGNDYTMGYYLADGIYPECATFVKSISKPQGEKHKLFAQYQEEQRKRSECCNASRHNSSGVGGSSNPSCRTPIQSSPNSQYSDFANPRGLDAIDLNDDDIEDWRQDSIQHWHWKEDEMLISTWLNISTDPVVGTDQKGETIWSQIHSYCVKFCSDMTRG
ncbi:uncharacterized protein LOC107611553 [Arachis ipaensis]|uniref:uncharacterized protein LOC107611553 n=1 Tax=Arachis ipaensis TaxID=130454 RepID=UPI000A2B7F9D|nr:uncharacterized protein LOC107611553 [Arachis ipaensis]